LVDAAVGLFVGAGKSHPHLALAAVGVGQTGVTSTGYPTDRFNFAVQTMGTYTLSQELDAPTGSGFRNSAKILVTTADASPAASDFCIFRQGIEGFNCQRILKGTASALTLTMTFWVKSTNTGTFIAYLNDATNTRYVSAAYTIDASNTWEKKTIIFPADTTGVLANSNAAAIYASFGLGAGSNFTGGTLATTWVTTQTSLLTGQTNLASAINQSWQVTGVQLELGSAPTSFEFVPFTEDLSRCQRYYLRRTSDSLFGAIALEIVQSGINAVGLIQTPVTMRSTPTLDTFASLRIYDGSVGPAVTALVVDSGSSNPTFAQLSLTASGGGMTLGRVALLQSNNTTAGFVGITAEL
jgi:hypothetical protein